MVDSTSTRQGWGVWATIHSYGWKVRMLCERKCTRNKLCSKYLFSTTEYHCWTWSYNRTDHIAIILTVTSMWAWSVLQAKCGSDKPLKVQSGVCYCDTECTTHLDCCLDYAEECVKQNFPSCEGLCKTAQAQAIEGGGYCWCLWMAVIHSLPTTTAWGAAVLITLNNASRSKCQHA